MTILKIEIVLKLLSKDLVASVHDISSGGLIVAGRRSQFGDMIDNQLIDNYLGSKDNEEIWAAVDEILKIKMA